MDGSTIAPLPAHPALAAHRTRAEMPRHPAALSRAHSFRPDLRFSAKDLCSLGQERDSETRVSVLSWDPDNTTGTCPLSSTRRLRKRWTRSSGRSFITSGTTLNSILRLTTLAPCPLS